MKEEIIPTVLSDLEDHSGKAVRRTQSGRDPGRRQASDSSISGIPGALGLESGTPRDRSRRSASKDRIGEDVQAIHATHREKPPNRNFVTE